jgi:hypothetical protein
MKKFDWRKSGEFGNFVLRKELAEVVHLNGE